MKDQRHKRKELFSVMLISNTDRKIRQLKITAPILMLLPALILVLCIALCVSLYTAHHYQMLATRQDTQLIELSSQIDSLHASLAEKDQAILAASMQAAAAEEASPKEEAEEEPADPAVPTAYPSTGTGVLKGTYADDHPYITLSTYSGGLIVAAGDGTVISVSSDDTYAHIVEIDHGNGYISRYLCRQQAQTEVDSDSSVHAGDTLITVTSDSTELDYQILYQEEPIDPLTLIDAKG